jgi:hypothetical protein
MGLAMHLGPAASYSCHLQTCRHWCWLLTGWDGMLRVPAQPRGGQHRTHTPPGQRQQQLHAVMLLLLGQRHQM